MWILAVLIPGHYQVVTWPYEYFDNYQVCMLYKDISEEKYRIPFVCTRESGA